MKRRTKYFAVFTALLGGLLLVISGCTSTTAPAPMAMTPYLSTISITPATDVSLDVGDTQQFTATAHYSDDSTDDITSKVNWSSTDTDVATISSSGLATIVADGATYISASMPLAGSTTVVQSQSTLVAAPSTVATIR